MSDKPSKKSKSTEPNKNSTEPNKNSAPEHPPATPRIVRTEAVNDGCD